MTLRPVGAADAAGLLAADPESVRLTGSHGHAALTLEDAEKWYGTPCCGTASGQSCP